MPSQPSYRRCQKCGAVRRASEFRRAQGPLHGAAQLQRRKCPACGFIGPLLGFPLAERPPDQEALLMPVGEAWFGHTRPRCAYCRQHGGWTCDWPGENSEKCGRLLCYRHRVVDGGEDRCREHAPPAEPVDLGPVRQRATGGS